MTNTVTWYRNSGGSTITWTASVASASIPTPTSLFLTDFDGDNRTDMLVGFHTPRTVAVLRNSNNTFVSTGIPSDAVGVQGVWAADLVRPARWCGVDLLF